MIILEEGFAESTISLKSGSQHMVFGGEEERKGRERERESSGFFFFFSELDLLIGSGRRHIGSLTRRRGGGSGSGEERE